MKKLAHVNIQLNQAQSRIFARAIYADIASYIETHSEEYQKFLEECEDERTNEIESTH